MPTVEEKSKIIPILHARMAYLIIGFVLGLTVGISAALGANLEPITHSEPVVVTNQQCFSPEHTICRIATMPGWKPVYHSKKNKIPRKSMLRGFETIICSDISQSGEFYLPQEWYK